MSPTMYIKHLEPGLALGDVNIHTLRQTKCNCGTNANGET